MLKKQFETVWNQLRAKKAQLPFYLDDVKLQRIRGMRDLKVSFPYPVTILAVPNACGKSTVLFACGCLYDSRKVQHEAVRRYPSDVFPSFDSKQIGGSCASR